MLLNNAFALIPMSALLWYFGEHTKWAKLREVTSWDWALLFFSCVNAIGISYAGINAQVREKRSSSSAPTHKTHTLTHTALMFSMRAQGYVSATTFMVLSNLNKFVVVAFGMLALHEARSWQAVIGVCMALLGGVWYAQARSAASASNVRPKG